MSTKNIRKLVASAVAVTALATTLAACGSSSSGSSPDDSAGKPVSGGTLTFYDPVNYTAWVPTNSIWSNSQVAGNLAERLVWQDPETGDFKPWLAESWTVSDDHLSYTFTLREGVTFSNGDPLDAETVKANFDQHGLGDDTLGIPKDPFWTDYAGTDVVDGRTLTIRLAKPNAAFLQILSNYRASSILGKPFLAQDLNGQGKVENWVGTGPFVVDSVDGTNGVTLVRRDDYDWAPEGSGHSGPAYLEKVVFKTVPEAGTRVGALESGEAQISRNIAPYDEETVEAAGGKLVAISVQGETNKLAILQDKPGAPTQELAVRQALQAATDREEINLTVLSPNYPIPTSALVQGTPLRGDASEYLTYDVKKANKLLEDADWEKGSDGIREKDGVRLEFHLRVPAVYQVAQPVLELLQSQWKKVGAEITLSSPSLTDYQSQVAANGPDWLFTQGQTSTAEPSVLRTVFGPDRQNALKLKPGQDPELEALLVAQSQAFDEADRKNAIQAIEEHLFGQAYEIPLYDETQVFGLASNVQGFATESTGRSWLYDTWLSE